MIDINPGGQYGGAYEEVVYSPSAADTHHYLTAAAHIAGLGVAVEPFATDETGRQAAIEFAATANYQNVQAEGPDRRYSPETGRVEVVPMRPMGEYAANATRRVDETIAAGGHVLRVTSVGLNPPLTESYFKARRGEL
jgi:hypothetical protein